MNPYEVLGVSETATDEQVRSAYIKLVKKYHPDRYQDSDLKDLANDKLKQVNEAYDTITNMRKNGSASQNTYSGSGFGGYSGSSSRSTVTPCFSMLHRVSTSRATSFNSSHTGKSGE